MEMTVYIQYEHPAFNEADCKYNGCSNFDMEPLKSDWKDFRKKSAKLRKDTVNSFINSYLPGWVLVSQIEICEYSDNLFFTVKKTY